MNDRREEKQTLLEDDSWDEVSLSAQFQTEIAQAQNARPSKQYAIYILILLTCTYMVNQLDKFSLAVVAKPIAQELRYGNQRCVVNKDLKYANNYLTNDQMNQWNKLCNEE